MSNLFFPFFLTLFFALLLAHALEDEEEYDEQHVIVVISKLLRGVLFLSVSLALSFKVIKYERCNESKVS